MTPIEQLTPPGPPQKTAHDWKRDIEALRIEFNRRLDEIQAGHDTHETRLDEHDRKFYSLEEGVREVRIKVHQTQGEIYRLVDAATSQALTIERQEKLLLMQSRALEAIALNVSAVLGLLQEKVTL